MHDNIDRSHHGQENEFHALCLEWRFRMLDTLRDYADGITKLDTPQSLPSLHEYYGKSILALLRELRQSAIHIAAIIDDQPVPPTNDNGAYLTHLFVDIRNPMSSFSILDQIVSSVPPVLANNASEVQAHMRGLVTRGHDLNHLVEELDRVRKRFTDGA